MSPSTVVVSAPGKVLFAGGFLVLDRQHTGLVFGLNARIHAIARPWVDAPRNLGERSILVESPQFLAARWLYRIGAKDGSEGPAMVTVDQVRNMEQDGFTASSNKFVETTLRYALTYLSHILHPSGSSDELLEGNLKITILADHDYYSRPQSAESSTTDSTATTTLQTKTSATTFANFGVKLSDAHKTGLGSSAALVTALVSVLLAFHSPKKDATEQEAPLDHRIIHNLAQAAHCAAQGKVGSGFDVAAAVFGSCLYRRFTPTILESVGEPTSAGFGERLHRCVDDLSLDLKWDVEVANHAVEIPDSLLLVMCDVDCGSETPGMVRKILQWRKDNIEEATVLWNALQQGQEELCRELRRLVEVHQLAERDEFTALGDVISTMRSLVREMSVKSDVPVEPPVITELLDFCTSIPGVVGGVAPGAGGYDAVALLLRNDLEVVKKLEAALEGWKSQDDSGAKIGNVRLLGVKQENDGIKVEEGVRYQEWL